MRAKEFLIEASIFDPKYPPGTVFTISGSATGNKLKTILADTVPNFDYNGPLEKVKKAGKKVVIGKGGNDLISLKDSKNKVITLQATKSLGSAFNHAAKAGSTVEENIANRGEISEGILGAAMFAKFAKREKGQVDDISVKDVQNVLSSVKKTKKDEYSISVTGINKYKDEITFILKLKSRPYADLLDPKKQKLLVNEYSSAVAFANSRHAHKYASYFFKNKKEDVIRIVSDGISDESGTKIDVFVEVQSPKGSETRRTNLAISLKAGPVKQFGQIGGPEFEKMQEIFGKFGVDLKGIKTQFDKQKDTIKQLSLAYETAANTMAKNLKADNKKKEKLFVKKLIDGIISFAAGGDEQVRIVHFHKGDFEILDPRKLSNLVNKVNLTAVYKPDNTGKPQVFIVDVNSGAALIRIRAKTENKVDKDGVPYLYVRNYIEKEKLFDKYAAMRK